MDVVRKVEGAGGAEANVTSILSWSVSGSTTTNASPSSRGLVTFLEGPRPRGPVCLNNVNESSSEGISLSDREDAVPPISPTGSRSVTYK